LKRGTPVSKGSYSPIVKKQSHLEIILSDEVKNNSADRNKILKEKNGTES